MKNTIIFSVLLFLVGGIYYANAKDFIALKGGGNIEAEVLEITSSEIRYRRLGSPPEFIYSMPLDKIRQVKYENGTEQNIRKNNNGVYEIIDLTPSSKETEPLTFALSTNAGEAIPIGELTPGGISVNFEFIKNNFYSFMNLSVPIIYKTKDVGFGFTGNFNYLWKSKIGDFFLGGGLGYTYLENHFFIFGANAGYRFVTSSGMYFSVGGFIGGEFSKEFSLYFNPILGVGYTF